MFKKLFKKKPKTIVLNPKDMHVYKNGKGDYSIFTYHDDIRIEIGRYTDTNDEYILNRTYEILCFIKDEPVTSKPICVI